MVTASPEQLCTIMINCWSELEAGDLELAMEYPQ